MERRTFTVDPPDDATRAAFAALMRLTDEQRLLVLCWFCRGCGRYIGPGDSCNCERDE
jgi:hypothetical protein